MFLIKNLCCIVQKKYEILRKKCVSPTNVF